MQLSDFPKVFQLISGRAEIQLRSTCRKTQALSTLLYLYLTCPKQPSHWKLESPAASTWQGTVKDLTAVILIHPSTVPFSCGPHNYVGGRCYHYFPEEETETQDTSNLSMTFKWQSWAYNSAFKSLEFWFAFFGATTIEWKGPFLLHLVGYSTYEFQNCYGGAILW